MLFILLSTFIACKKDKGGSDPTPPPPPPPPPPTTSSYPTKDIQVELPAGVTIDLTTCEVQSLSVNSKIDNSGKVKIAFNKGYPNIAYLFDKDDKLLMAGFITDTTATIDVASTAKVLLYFSYGVAMQPYEVTQKFITGIETVPGVKDWISQFTTLFKQDPYVVSKRGFADALKTKMAELVQKGTVDINAKKASDIQVDANDIKSGLQIVEDGLSQFSIMNTYRRRAHAFLYKMSYKDANDVPQNHLVLSNIQKTTTADKDFIVDPAGGVTSFIGTVGAWIEGKGMDFFVVKSGPTELALNDNESEATYKLRVIGPAATVQNGLTDKEQAKLLRLAVETFAIDLVFPVFMEAVGNKDDFGAKFKTEAGKKAVDAFVSTTEIVLNTMPTVYDELRKGSDYKIVLRKFLEALLESGNSKYFEDMVKGTALVLEMIVQQKYYVPGNVDVLKEIEQKLNVLKVIDVCLYATDLIRIASSLLSSNALEEWKIVARSGQVSLSPQQKTLVPFEQLKISAIIKNSSFPEDVHPFFEWSTSGKYGKLTDTKGHTNLASFGSADSSVFYVSKVSNTSLSDGDNLDYIYVSAFIGNKKIGTDTMVVNIIKNDYVIKPDGITASGKEDAKNHNIQLYLEKTKGVNDIVPNDSVDYKVVWTTSGKYGKLSGNGTGNVNVLTVYNSNKAMYECLDKDTKEGVENVKVLIYRKKKTESQSEYMLFGEDESTIKINNDPKKKTFIVAVDYFKKILTPSVGNWAVFPGIRFDVDSNAKSYSVRLFNFTGTFVSPPENVVYTWEAGKLPPTPYNIYAPTFDIDGGMQYMVWGRTWCGGPCDESGTATWIANYKKGYGPSPKAEVTVTLK